MRVVALFVLTITHVGQPAATVVPSCNPCATGTLVQFSGSGYSPNLGGNFQQSLILGIYCGPNPTTKNPRTIFNFRTGTDANGNMTGVLFKENGGIQPVTFAFPSYTSGMVCVVNTEVSVTSTNYEILAQIEVNVQ
jgi:hypothetical protein